MNRCLVIIDMLNDFLPGGKIPCERGVRVIPVIQSLIQKFRKNGSPIVYANDSHLPEIDLEFKMWGSHAIRNTYSSDVIKELSPMSSDHIVLKRRYSSFSGTDLQYFLIEKNICSIVLVGLHTHICVKHTAYDAFLLGYSIEVIEDGVEALTEEDHIYGLNYLKKVYGVKVLKEKDFKF